MKRLAVALVTLTLLATPLAVEGQQPERIRHIGVLHYLLENDPEGRAYVRAFLQTLQESGWIVDRNLRIDYRWTGGDPDRTRKSAVELVALAPDVILAAGGSQVRPLQQATRTIPVVFVQVADAVGGGFVNSLARPGGNATGFTNFEFNISAKWLELLKQVTPRMTRTAVLRDPANPSGTGQFGAIQAVAPAFIASLAALEAVGAQPPTPVPRQAGLVERLPATVDLTARYVGILSGSADGTGFEALITADLIQAGNRLIGSWFMSGFSGTVTGTVMGPSTFSVEIRSTRPCMSVLRGSGVIEDGGAVLHGSYGGAGCAGWITASFRVNRHLTVGTGARLAMFHGGQ